ncbi:MAG TPA: hypothetical protein VF258_08985, partial [Luteolibacter sp.]
EKSAHFLVSSLDLGDAGGWIHHHPSSDSADAEKGIRRKKWVGWLMLLGGIGIFFTGFNLPEGSATGLCIFGGILMLISSLVAFIVSTPVKAVKFRDGWFRVKGCCPEFLDSLPIMPASPF